MPFCIPQPSRGESPSFFGKSCGKQARVPSGFPKRRGGGPANGTGRRARSEKPAHAGFGRAFPSATRKRHGRKDAPTGGVRRRRKETDRLAGSAQRSAKALHLCGNGNGLTAPILSSSPAVPLPQSAAGGGGGGRNRRRPVGPDRLPARQSASFRAWHFQLRRRTRPHSGRPYPARHFSATRLIRCRTRHFPLRPTILCRMPRFSQRRSTAALCVPLAAHEISLCARPRFAVPDAFANRRSIVDGRTRRFLLRTPWPTVPAMPDDAPPSPNARQLCPAPLFCRPSLHSEVSLN